MSTILLSHFAATWSMVGVIWFVQLVHYPLLQRVGQESFVQYELDNTRRTTWVVAPLMLVELATAVFLAIRPPTDELAAVAWLGAGAVAAIWLSTALVQVPLHRRLSHRFDEVDARRLVATNWFRTCAWTGRGVLAAYLVA